MNRFAVLSFVLVLLLGPLVVPFTLPLAFVARQQIHRSGQDGAGLAKAAILIGYVHLALGITVLALYLYLAHGDAAGVAMSTERPILARHPAMT